MSIRSSIGRSAALDSHAMTTPAARTVVFDLDHTLIRFDSFAWFVHYLLWRWWRLPLALLLSPAVALLWIAARTRLYAVSMLVWCGTVGKDEQDLFRWMDRYVAKVFDDPKSPEWVCHGAIREVHRHLSEGARVVVATGSVAQLAERVCHKLGIVNVEVVGSTLQRWRGGCVADRHCFGKRKVSMLREHGLVQWDVVYTDSAADLPLLTHGIRRYVVNPTAADRKKILDLLGSDLEVVEWT
jgi:phosphatidylglycerophosphatase C